MHHSRAKSLIGSVNKHLHIEDSSGSFPQLRMKIQRTIGAEHPKATGQTHHRQVASSKTYSVNSQFTIKNHH
jgi:hypothetical protein